MNNDNIIPQLVYRSSGEVYLGVVGAVRSGKSTFIKKFIESLVVPNIVSEEEKVKCLDEMPQSAQGKTIMTTEPKFVPSSGASVHIDGYDAKIKLVDCVGFVIPGASGFEDEEGNPRMVKTPWFPDSIPFVEAAEIGTEKVIKDHTSIGIVITSDGSFGEIKRECYIDAEEKVIMKLKEYGKPFVVILNTTKPNDEDTINLASSMRDVYDVPVIPTDIENMSNKEVMNILKEALNEFPVLDICFNVPKWVHVLNNEHYVKKEYIDMIKRCVVNVNKVRDTYEITKYFENSNYIEKAYISDVDSTSGIVTINLDTSDKLYNEVLKEFMGEDKMSKALIMKTFANLDHDNNEVEKIKNALNEVKQTGYSIMYPSIKDMKLDTPEIIKDGSRYGVKLKAVASSVHLIKCDVESVFEPIIGSEMQSKELIEYIMKDYESDKNSIWSSEIFGRSLENIVSDGIKAKLTQMPDNTRVKLSNTVTKIVNKGSNNLIAIVI